MNYREGFPLEKVREKIGSTKFLLTKTKDFPSRLLILF